MPVKPHVVHLALPDDIEQQFYDAMRHGDVVRLMAVWMDDDDIVCVHPGGPRVVGIAAVRANFAALLAEGGVDARAEHVRRVQTHASAVHSVLERVQVHTADGPQSVCVIATNVYLKTAQGWRMVAHHASPATAHDVQERADAAMTLH